VRILEVRLSRDLETIESRIGWFPTWALGASAPTVDAETLEKTQNAESAKRASAENDLDCGSDALRDRDHLALIAVLPVRFRESDGRSDKQPATLTTRKKDRGTALMRPRNDS
jgi:hypothetical protein